MQYNYAGELCIEKTRYCSNLILMEVGAGREALESAGGHPVNAFFAFQM